MKHSFIRKRKGCITKRRMLSLALMFVSSMALFSCSTVRTTCVGYQSIRTTYKQPTQVPEDAEIVVAFKITEEGEITPIVHNLTDEIMIIDNTKSFFVKWDGSSYSYYDPTVRTVTNTSTYGSSTTYASANSNVNATKTGVSQTVIGGSSTSNSVFTTTDVSTFVDQPTISLGPRGKGAMAHTYRIGKVGTGFIDANETKTFAETNITPKESYCKFSVTISYSTDNGRSFKKIVTDFYANSLLIQPVKKTGLRKPLETYYVNDALREIYKAKPDLLDEQWFLLSFDVKARPSRNVNFTPEEWNCIHPWYTTFTTGYYFINFQ